MNLWNDLQTVGRNDNWFSKPTWNTEFLDFNSDEDLVRLAGTAIASGTGAVFDVTTSFGSSGGFLRLANNASDDDSGYNWSSDAQTISLAKSTTLQFKTRVRQSDATQSDFLIGLALADTSLMASAPSSGIYFLKADGAATWKLYISGTAVSDAIATNVDATWQELGFEIVMDASTASKGAIRVIVDGACVYSAVVSTLPAATVGMGFAIAWQSGEGAAKTADVDYIAWRQTRNAGVL